MCLHLISVQMETEVIMKSAGQFLESWDHTDVSEHSGAENQCFTVLPSGFSISHPGNQHFNLTTQTLTYCIYIWHVNYPVQKY